VGRVDPAGAASLKRQLLALLGVTDGVATAAV